MGQQKVCRSLRLTGYRPPGPQELVLFLVLPVHNSFPLQVLQATAHLGGIEDGSLLVEAGVAQVVNVELQVPSIHNG